MKQPSIINDYKISSKGEQKIAWVSNHMPIMNELLKSFGNKQPLENYEIATSVHMEAKTAYLIRALAKLGAKVYATGCNPLSTQDDVAAALSKTPNVAVYARHACNNETYWHFLKMALKNRPHIIIDDGGDLVELLIGECKEYSDRLIGGCEETTTGIHRLKALVETKRLPFPMFDVNDADCKHNYDNHYGTGQSVLDGILRTTNLILAGKTAVVAGYGDCGSGIASRLKGMGMKVIVTEIDPIKALKANMDGHTVMPMNKAAKLGDLFVTATGCRDVITKRHFLTMKNGALLANAGHFDVEVNVEELKTIAKKHFEARHNIESYQLENDNIINLLAEGRLVNLAAADGHAAEIMDMSFSIQLLTVLYIAESTNGTHGLLFDDLYPVPRAIDQKVAELALKAQNLKIDTLTKAQKSYLENGF